MTYYDCIQKLLHLVHSLESESRKTSEFTFSIHWIHWIHWIQILKLFFFSFIMFFFFLFLSFVRAQYPAQISMLSYGERSIYRGKFLITVLILECRGYFQSLEPQKPLSNLKSKNSALKMTQYFVENWHRKSRAGWEWWCLWNVLSANAVHLHMLCC